MRAFIYDKYGYYPPEEFSTSFEYQGWFFKLEISEKNDAEIHSLRLMLNELNQAFENLGSDVMMTRDGHYVSASKYGPVVLVAIRIGEVDFSTLTKIHSLYLGKFQKTHLMISHLRNLWMHKADVIEERILPSLPKDDKKFSDVHLLGHYALGMAENAVQYLLDTALYYGDEVRLTTLAHKRIDALDSFYLFNPFNFVIDSPMRDFAELYKNSLISMESMYDLLRQYPLDAQAASLLLARCLFPNQIFDILEDYYELKKDIRKRTDLMMDALDSQLLKLKKLHRFLVKNYGIRPVSWLE